MILSTLPILGLVIGLRSGLALPNVYDCWDERKLERMDIDLAPHESADPGLSRFTKMLKCLNAQSPGSASSLDADWRQWSESRRPANDKKYYDKTIKNEYNNYYENDKTDFRADRTNYEKINYGDERRRPPPSPPRRPPPRRPGDRPDLMPDVDYSSNDGEDRFAVKSWPPRKTDSRGPAYSDAGAVEDDYLFFEDKEKSMVGNTGMEEMSKTAVVSRKYGFVLMAFVVVCLAILMVFAIFCCSSSNSTMSQANNANAALFAAPDAFSIYSFNNGNSQGKIVAADTLRSVAMPHIHNTETMKSSRSVQSRASPQFRVSDIDPRFHHHA